MRQCKAPRWSPLIAAILAAVAHLSLSLSLARCEGPVGPSMIRPLLVAVLTTSATALPRQLQAGGRPDKCTDDASFQA